MNELKKKIILSTLSHLRLKNTKGWMGNANEKITMIKSNENTIVKILEDFCFTR